MRVLLDTNVLLYSPIPVWDPPELLQRLAAATTPPTAGGPASGVP